MINVREQLNPYLSGSDLVEALTSLPPTREVRTTEDRINALLDVYKIYIPNDCAIEIYNSLYMSLLSSLESKNSIAETKLLNDNYRSINKMKRYGVIGGLESFKITGGAGLGKSSCIQRCADVIADNRVLVSKEPYREIIPILVVECVSDGSFKNLLYEILKQVDGRLGTTFFEANYRITVTVDMLLAAVSNVLINHVAVLVIDEIERVANDSRKGTTLMNYLTQLVNQSNVSICFVGNECSNDYFMNKEYLSRRTVGLNMEAMEYDDYFRAFCEVLFKYQYTVSQGKLEESLLRTLYETTGGTPATLISLFVESQKRAIIKGTGPITRELIHETYDKYFSNLKPYVKKVEIEKSQERKKAVSVKKHDGSSCDCIFEKAFRLCKRDVGFFMEIIKENVLVEHIKI